MEWPFYGNRRVAVNFAARDRPTIRGSPGSCGRRLSPRIECGDSSDYRRQPETLCSRTSPATSSRRVNSGGGPHVRPTAKGFVILAVLLDAWSRKRGYTSALPDYRLATANDPARRSPRPAPVDPSLDPADSIRRQYRERLEALGMNGSMGRTGIHYDT